MLSSWAAHNFSLTRSTGLDWSAEPTGAAGATDWSAEPAGADSWGAAPAGATSGWD